MKMDKTYTVKELANSNKGNEKMSTEKIWLKKEQAAEYLGIAIRTFDDKVKKGILPKPEASPWRLKVNS